MSPLLQAELLKLRTTRTFVALVGVTAFTSLLIVVLVCLLTAARRIGAARCLHDRHEQPVHPRARHGRHHRRVAPPHDRGRGAGGAEPGAFPRGQDRRVRGRRDRAVGGVSISVAVVASVLLSARDVPLPDVWEIAGQIARNAAIAALLGALGVAAGRSCASRSSRSSACWCCRSRSSRRCWRSRRRWSLRAVRRPAGLDPGRAARRARDRQGPRSRRPAVFVMLAWIAALWGAGAALLRRRDVG